MNSSESALLKYMRKKGREVTQEQPVFLAALDENSHFMGHKHLANKILQKARTVSMFICKNRIRKMGQREN